MYCVLFFLFVTRLFADVLNDIAMFMEILAPYFPACFTLIVCTAGIFKVNKNCNKLSQMWFFFFFKKAEKMWFEMETTNQVCLLQSLVGVAGGATRAALTVHQARRDNMADISAKDGSQVLFFLQIFLDLWLVLSSNCWLWSKQSVQRSITWTHSCAFTI